MKLLRILLSIAVLAAAMGGIGGCRKAESGSSSSGLTPRTTAPETSETDPYGGLQEKEKPVCSGTFIQSYLFSDWTDERWGKELSCMKECGMKYIVLDETAVYKNGAWELCKYPSEIPELKAVSSDKDTIEPVLRNCSKYGIKVFVGLPNVTNGSGFDFSADHMTTAMEVGAEMAEEMYKKYHAEFGDTLYGWYWVPELANFSDLYDQSKRAEYVSTFSNSFNLILDKISQIDGTMPLLFSPYYTLSGIGSDDNCKFLQDLFGQIHFRNSDILMPQDSIGAGGGEIEYLDYWLKSFRKAADSRGIRFWVNNECFVTVPKEQGDYYADPVGRFVQQMKISSKYTDTLISFAFSHYYSPYVTCDGYYRTYKQYLDTGKVDSEAPSAPVLKIEDENDSRFISWSATDNIGICGYRVYKNDQQVYQQYVSRDGNVWDLDTQYYVGAADPTGAAKYSIEVIDFAGNVSPRTTIAC